MPIPKRHDLDPRDSNRNRHQRLDPATIADLLDRDQRERDSIAVTDPDDLGDDATADAPSYEGARSPRHMAAAPRATHKPAQPKTSYESNADVQRWLREQAVQQGDSSGKPPFNPTFLAGQRDREWVLSSLTHFYEDDLIADVLYVARSGKEATVYCCAATPATGYTHLAAKVYRPRMFRSLKNDAVYRESRAAYDEHGHELRPGRRMRQASRWSERSRAAQVSAWIAYEYHTQRLLHDAGADVPQPFSQIGNATLMAYIGDAQRAAPLLRDAPLTADAAATLFARILANIELFLTHNRVHGDLSEYNILYWEGQITIIDFAQAVDPRYSSGVAELLARDIERVCAYFARYGVAADPASLARDLWTRYMGGRL